MSTYDDFLYSGYGSKMSFGQYQREICGLPVTRFANMDDFDTWAGSGLGSSMSFNEYCRQNGLAQNPIFDTPTNTIPYTPPVSYTKSKKQLDRETTRSKLKAELLEQAKKLAESKDFDEVDASIINSWRIGHGYLWETVSPKGNRYREVLKQVTIDNPEDYVVFNALKIAYTRNTGGLNYVSSCSY